MGESLSTFYKHISHLAFRMNLIYNFRMTFNQPLRNLPSFFGDIFKASIESSRI